MIGDHRVGQDVHVEQLRLPASLDAGDARDFLDFSDLTDAVQQQIWGHQDRCSPPEYRLEVWRDNAYDQTAMFFVRDAGRMVGRAWCRLALKEDRERATVRAEVLQEYSGRGIGRALLAAATEEARRRGRTLLDTFTEHPAGSGEAVVESADAVVPSTGTGALPASDRSVRFAQAAGFSLSQVVRFSELQIAEHEAVWPALEEAARAASEAEYEVLTWDRTPEEHLEAMAELMGRMSIDAPQGVDTTDPQKWDAARVAALEDMLAAAGTVPLYAVARHRASGELAGYTALWIRRGKEPVGDQDDTLVRSGHRGHALGMRLKLANLAQYRSRYPQARKVVTFNAAENGHMLGINTALGFRPAGYDGEWYRRMT